ncbi:MAG: protein translocase subunit SecF [Patescibacteria group bacterium]
MIRFSKYIWLYFFISALVLVPGVFALVRWGLKPAIDFTGGTLLELQFASDIPASAIEIIGKNEQMPIASVQKTEGNTFIVRMNPEGSEQIAKFQSSLAQATKEMPQVLRNETVGPVLGKELLGKTVIAALVAIIGILLYVAWAFKNYKFGLSAVLALAHDLSVVLGMFALFGHFLNIEVDTLFVTAVLTTMSFSVHDTIVVFDRIREMLKRADRSAGADFDALCDRALTQTMGRSLANSLTIIFMLVAIALLGGTTIRWFVVALLIGTVSGTYSSPFIATPILILWDRWEKRKKI